MVDISLRERHAAYFLPSLSSGYRTCNAFLHLEHAPWPRERAEWYMERPKSRGVHTFAD